MIEFSLFLKTYRDDLRYVERLLQSFHRFNVTNLPLYIAAPRADVEMFREHESGHVHILCDDDVTDEFLTPDEEARLAIHPGAANAGVVKLAFGTAGITQFYLSLDSDMVFLRPFSANEFFDGDGKPLLVARPYPELKADPFYRERYWDERVRQYDRALSTLGVADPLHRTCHNTQVMSADAVASLRQKLGSLGMRLGTAMSISPMEYFWYGAWVLGEDSRGQGLHSSQPVDDLARMVHHQGDHLALHMTGVRAIDLSHSFLGVVVNSNWSRQYGLVHFDEPPIERYLSEGVYALWMSKQRDDALTRLLAGAAGETQGETTT